MNGYFNYKDELYHHGVLGMKWGVRRYQNKDGSLTTKGREHIKNTSSKKLVKEFKRDVRKKRKEIHGSANQFMWSNHIGDNTKKLFEEKKKLRQEYEKSKEYKDWEKKLKSFEKNHPEYYDGYDDDFNKIMDERPKKQFNDILSAKVLTKNGWEFCDKEFAKKGGAELSMAKLKDLGYNDESAKYIVDKLIKENQAID